MNVVLVMFRENGERRSFSLSRDVTVVGRREDADFRVPLTDVSRKHCRLIKDGNILLLEDLGSANGTYHNGRRVQEAEIQPGDTLRIGPVQFIVQIDGVPTEEALGGNVGSGLGDSAATMVTPAVTVSPPTPPGGSAPPPPPPPMMELNQPTIDDGPVDYADNVFAPPESVSADAEVVSEAVETDHVEEVHRSADISSRDGVAARYPPAPDAAVATPEPAELDDADHDAFNFVEDTGGSIAGDDDVLIDFDLPDPPNS